MSLKPFFSQTWALIRKNLILICVRSWLSTLIRGYILPIALITILYHIPEFTEKKRTGYGYGDFTTVRNLEDVLGDGKLVLIKDNNEPGADVQRLFNTITEPLSNDANVVQINSTDDLRASLMDECPVDNKGHSPCFAAVVVHDSPLSDGGEGIWNYSIRADPSQMSYKFDTSSFKDPLDVTFLPLQASIENAMTNFTEMPDYLKYTTGTEAGAEYDNRQGWLSTVQWSIQFLIIFSAASVVQHISAMVSRDREAGLSDLIDSMSGGSAWARTISWIVTFDIVYLPLWLILGCLHAYLLFDTSSAAIVIFWQILGGFAITSGSVFGSAFFTKTQIASSAVFLISILFGVLGGVLGSDAGVGEVITCSLLFPPFAWTVFFARILSGEIEEKPINLLEVLKIPWDSDTPWVLKTTPWHESAVPLVILMFFVIQIFVYAGSAALVEKLLHGKKFRTKDFDSTSGNDHIAVQTTSLVKHYHPSWFNKVFCCGAKRRKVVKAVDGLDLVSHKNQVLCLLGHNGSGKTTTLDMLAGTQTQTSGSIQLKVLPTQLGVCPQRNVLWGKLTVYEHLLVWNQLKGGVEDSAAIERLIEKCDLAQKRNHLSKTLSGGMKRKLQLACMLIGGSSVCLLDEVTSGLDPLSRRAIWNVILSERSHRTMILTTHFLDEAEVLADHIVILSLGNTKCQGSPAQLKSQYGGGYHVSLPKTADVSQLTYPVAKKDDQYICTVPDSRTAVQVLSGFKDLGNSQSCITGPTIEDVFLRVSEQPSTEDIALEEQPTASSANSTLLDRKPSSRVKTFFAQFRALLIKRLTILRSHWWIYGFAILIPVLCTHFLGDELRYYKFPKCGRPEPNDPYVYSYDFWPMEATGPPAALESSLDIVAKEDEYFSRESFEDQTWPDFNTRDELAKYAYKERPYEGALWAPNNTAPTIWMSMDFGASNALATFNMANRLRSGVNMTAAMGELVSYTSPQHRYTLFYTVIVCLVQTIYPAFFAIYPAYERTTQVRALQYSNGIRPAPLLAAYFTFDFMFVIVIAILVTVLASAAGPFWGIGYIFFVLMLYGMAATMLVYLVSRVARSQPGAFIMSFLLSVLMYALSIISVTVVNTGSARDIKSVDGIAFGLGILFPIQNVFRAFDLGLNGNGVRCRDEGLLTDPGSIYGYGGPIFLLILQIIGLFFLTLYVEGIQINWLRRKPRTGITDGEAVMTTGRADVEAEKKRVVESDVDLLRLLNVSKSFGKNVAVDDVSFGLKSGEIMALLGPNGAGKTTTINMIRGDLPPDSGRIYLEGYDTLTNTRHAQEHLGVCPQFDALDLLTVREHLQFYARCKGVPEIKAQIETVMALVGITPHATKMASKLSGGNKRKLSLAIALLGNPPVLILDEPSSAMDASSKRILWKTLEAVSPGRSVLITTHSMEEADALSTRAAILAKRMLAIGTIRELRESYSNEYHVHLVLKSAPTSSQTEMADVSTWVCDTFGSQVQMDGEHLGGQIRFIVPIDSPVPASAPKDQSFAQYMIEKLEAKKEELGLDCYSINTATMERVFLSVMKTSDMDEDTTVEKRKWWQF